MTTKKRQQKEQVGLLMYAFAVYNIISNLSIDKKMFNDGFKDNGTLLSLHVFSLVGLKRKIQYKK